MEHLLFRTADRLQRAIAINAVIAWRIMLMTLLGRRVPDCDPDLMFTDAELGFLRDYARKHDPDPGNQIMWTGYNRLAIAVIGHEVGYDVGFQAGRRHGSFCAIPSGAGSSPVSRERRSRPDRSG